MKEQSQLQVGNNSELKSLASKRIGETLELLEYAGLQQKQVELVRKAMWRIFDELVLSKKVGANDKSNN